MAEETKGKFIPEDVLKSCFRCGLCRTVCPSFAIHGLESASPRGRIQFARALIEKKVVPDSAIKEKIFDCLTCMSCGQVCPAGVRTDHLMLSMRAELKNGKIVSSIIEKFLGMLMKNSTLLRTAVKISAIGQRVIGINGPIATLIPRIAGLQDRKLPVVALKSSLSILPPVIPAQGKKKARVGYFIGCAANFLYPGTAEAITRVLSSNGFEVLIPQKQVCCGIPVYSKGFFKTAAELAEKNLEVFGRESIDLIVTGCPACATALKTETSELFGTGSFNVPVYDSFELLTDSGDVEKNYGSVDMKITFHDPCHMTRGLGMRSQPRDIVRDIPGIEIAEMRDSDSCCGGAGTFAFTRHKASLQVGLEKVKAIKETGADHVCTSCPSCRMQLDYLISREGLAMNVIHPLELIDMAKSKK